MLHALVDGDVVYGPLWDGNLEVLDSATAVVLGNFYAIEADGFVVARMDAASPLPPTTAGPGFLGFVTMVASSNEYDVWVYNSSSVAAGDFYSEGAQPSSRAHARASPFTPTPVFVICSRDIPLLPLRHGRCGVPARGRGAPLLKVQFKQRALGCRCSGRI